jgi:hypothetical protein
MVFDDFRRVAVYGPSVGAAYPWQFWDWQGAAWFSKAADSLDPDVQALARTEYGAMAFDSYRRRTIYFGGMQGVAQNTTASYDGANWDRLTNSPVLPAPRTRTAMAYDSARQAVVMFGGDLKGYSPHVPTNDTWELIAVDKPIINEQPASQYRQAGETALMNVSAFGPPGQTLNYQWLREASPLRNDERISGVTTPALAINAVQPRDAGHYRLRVWSACGETMTIPALLTLTAKLQIFTAASTATLLWSDPNVVLEQADDPAGPWSPVPRATSPFTPASMAPASFFRLRY